MQSVECSDVDKLDLRFKDVLDGNYERRRKMHVEVGESVKGLVRREIGSSGLNDRRAKVRLWQKDYIGSGGGYAAENGTSMACPIVTGIGAALLSGDSKLRFKDRSILRSLEILQRIQGCCESIGLDQTFEGFGQPFLR